ncbi:MAG: Unknown protein [uncultured Thiotrichaceae bacterium]|uniref:Uncharacterized protein n=1 Tax=uncultured Thiotrichaceae bacterium TaxID=298394 RepID=A0A6S6UH48_9GAMM|nr:MAG: Unknown protein [uncultured Thiotrichaceae bacterium]
MDNYRLTSAERHKVVLNTNIVDMLKLAKFRTQYNQILRALLQIRHVRIEREDR